MNNRSDKPRLTREEAEKALKERMRQVMCDWDTNSSRVARWSEYISEPTLSSQINKAETKVTGLALLAIAEYAPDLSAEWLLRGVGERKAGEVRIVHPQQLPPPLQVKPQAEQKQLPPQVQSSPAPSKTEGNNGELQKLLASYKERCARLEKELERANKRIGLLIERV